MAAREHVQLLHGPNCGCITHRHERAVAAAKAQAVAPKPVLEQREVTGQADDTPKRAAMKPKKVAAGPSVINRPVSESSVINPAAARKRGRPIKSNDTAHQQGRERSRLYRERKASMQASKERV